MSRWSWPARITASLASALVVIVVWTIVAVDASPKRPSWCTEGPCPGKGTTALFGVYLFVLVGAVFVLSTAIWAISAAITQWRSRPQSGGHH